MLFFTGMKTRPSLTLSIFLTTAIFSSSLSALDISLVNSSLDCSGSHLQGWQVSNADTLTTTSGETVVLLPGEFPARFSKLWQRMPFDGNSYTSLRVEMKVRTVERTDLDIVDTTLSKPRLRIFYFPDETRWKDDDAIWPQGKEGIFLAIDQVDGWQTVNFELECPEESRNVEIAVETDNPGYSVEVDEVFIEALPRS